MIELALELPSPKPGGFRLEVNGTLHTASAAVLGRSGAGKTTLLEVLAGLRTEARGRIVVDGDVWLDTARKRRLPPERRRVGYVPQEALLFPHLTALENLRFAAKPGAALDALVSVLELTPLLERHPAALSGGERQRVALGRALATEPRLLLLDEPLAAVDVVLKERVLPYLLEVKERFKVPFVYVTHQVGEALALVDEVVLLEGGKVSALGSVSEVGARLRAFTGGSSLENVLPGTLRAGADGRITRLEVSSELVLEVPPSSRPEGSRAVYSVRAGDVLLAQSSVSGLSARNVLPARVLTLEKGAEDDVQVRCQLAGVVLEAQLTFAAVEALTLTPGADVFVALKAHTLTPIR